MNTTENNVSHYSVVMTQNKSELDEGIIFPYYYDSYDKAVQIFKKLALQETLRLTEFNGIIELELLSVYDNGAICVLKSLTINAN